MPQYRIRMQRELTEIVEAENVENAALVAKTIVSRDPTLKLLDVIRLDLLTKTLEGDQTTNEPQ